MIELWGAMLVQAAFNKFGRTRKNERAATSIPSARVGSLQHSVRPRARKQRFISNAAAYCPVEKEDGAE